MRSNRLMADEYTESIYEGLTCISNTFATATAPSVPHVPPVPTTTPSISTIGKVKLPRITLPHFNGSLLKWALFWDSYESAAHRNKNFK